MDSAASAEAESFWDSCRHFGPCKLPHGFDVYLGRLHEEWDATRLKLVAAGGGALCPGHARAQANRVLCSIGTEPGCPQDDAKSIRRACLQEQ